MIKRPELENLQLTHGRVTHCTYKEGGMWWRVQEGAAPMLSMVHALRFTDGAMWDEINGIRPEDMWYDPDQVQRDLKK